MITSTVCLIKKVPTISDEPHIHLGQMQVRVIQTVLVVKEELLVHFSDSVYSCFNRANGAQLQLPTEIINSAILVIM